MRFAPLMKPIVLALAFVLLSTPTHAHDDEEFAHDRQPPYSGAGYRADEGGSPPISFPSSGITLGSWLPLLDFDPATTSASDCWGYTSPSGREYAIIGLSNGTGFVEVTNPGNAQILSVMSGPTSLWRDIKVFDEYAYVGSEGGGGIQVFDLGQIDAGTITLANTVTSGGRLSSHNVAINESTGYLYRAGGGGNPVLGLRIYDLADPSNPQFVAEWNDRYCHDAQVVTWTWPPFFQKEIAFCYANDGLGGGNPGVDILDVTDKGNITLLGSINLSLPPIFSHAALYSHQGWLSPNQRYLYFGDEVDEGSLGTPTTTRVISLLDLTNPVQVATFSNGNTSRDHNVYTLGNRVFEANYRSGLRVFDATDPIAPLEIAYFDTYPDDDLAHYNGLWNVYPYLPSGTLLGSDLEKGLFVWTPDQSVLPTFPIPALSVTGTTLFLFILLIVTARRRLRRRVDL